MTEGLRTKIQWWNAAPTIEARGLYDGATIAVMADHGESLERTAKIRTEFFFTMRRSGCAADQAAGRVGDGNLRRESESRRGWSWRM